MLIKNKKAYHDYEVLDSLEAGIILTGAETKSVKAGMCNLKGAFIDCDTKSCYLKEVHISRYSYSNDQHYNPTRKRNLLLHKAEIAKINGRISEKGITAIPLEIYLKNNIIKVKIGICKGKKLHDKRKQLKEKAQKLEIDKALKRYS